MTSSFGFRYNLYLKTPDFSGLLYIKPATIYTTVNTMILTGIVFKESVRVVRNKFQS